MSRSLVVYDDRSGEILLRLEGFSGSAPTDPKTIMPFAPEGARCRVVEEDLDPLLSASRISPVDSKVIPARILHSPPVSSSGNKVAIVTPHGFVAGTTKYNLVLAQSLIRQGLQASLFFMSPCVEEVKRYLEDSEIPFLVGTPEAAAHFAGEHSCVIWHGGGGEMSVFANELSRLEVRPHSTYVVHMENDFPMVGYAAQIIERTVVVGRWMLSSFPYATWCPPPAVIEPQEGERDPRTMVYLGRLAEHKGLENLVRSLSILEDFRLVLVGAGPLKEELVSLAEGLGCSERLSILGGDMRATRHLSKGGVFVLPSESEGASVALVEALAAGLKVVSTPVGDAVWLAEEKRAPVTLIENNQVASIVSGIVSSFGVEREPVVPPQYTSSHFEQVWRHTLPISLTAPPNAASQGKRPSVSVLMPVYQYKEVMDGAISSVLKQDLGELEVVAVDNGNQDDTYDRLLEWQKQDARVVPIPIEKNVGLPGARNRAARAARGDWVCFLDPDDRYLPGFLGERMEMMRGNKKAVLSIGQAIAVHNGHPCGIMPSAPYDRRVQSGNNRVLCQSVMMPHWALVAAGGNERWRYAEDWGLWARLAAVGEVLFDERPVYELHAHEQQRSRITSEGLQEKYDCNMRASFHNAFCAGFNRPLHVLMVLPDLFLHGAQRMALSVATRLQEAGNTVDVASLFSYDDVPIEWARSGLNMLPAMGPHQLIERAREGGYDVGFIHCWSGGGIVASTHLPLPAVVVHHSVDVDSRPPVNDVLRVHVAVAPKSRARFSFDPVEDGASPTNTHICNGVDAESIRSLLIGKKQARRELGIEEDVRLVVTVTRADYEKGADIFAEAAGSFPEGTRAVAIGVSYGQPLFETVASKFSLVGVERLGLTPWEKVLRWIEAADVFVVPSRQEAHSLAVMESLVAKTPVVGAASALPEEEIDGLYRIEKPDAGLLAEKVAEVLESGPSVGDLPEDWDWDTVSFKYGAMLRLLSLRERWSRCEDGSLREPRFPQLTPVSLVLPQGRAKAFGLMVKSSLERGGFTVCQEGESEYSLILSEDGKRLLVRFGEKELGTICFDPQEFGNEPQGSFLCLPPVEVVPVEQGANPIFVGEAPALRSGRAMPASSGPKDFEGALFAVVGDWLDALYALAAGIPVASVSGSYGLTCNWYSGIVSTPETVERETSFLGRDTWVFYADNIRRFGKLLYAPDGRLESLVSSLLGKGCL